MSIKYFRTKSDYCVARIGKVGSSALGRAIVHHHYPELLAPTEKDTDGQHQLMQADPNPPFITPDDLRGGRIKAIIPIRDVVERFRSACGEVRLPPDEALDKLENTDFGDVDFHFKPALRWVSGTGIVLRFPEDLELLCELTGLPDIPRHNTAEQRKLEKPDLDVYQVGRVLEFYAQDQVLRDQAVH